MGNLKPLGANTDESGTFTYTTVYGVAETDISTLFTTPLIGTTRRKYSVIFDILGLVDDAAAWTELTVVLKVKADGITYRTIGVPQTFAKTGLPLYNVHVDIPAVAQDCQITFKLDVALDANQTVNYSYVKEALE